MRQKSHDSPALWPLIYDIPSVRSRPGPRRHRPPRLHADKSYDSADTRRKLRQHGIACRIARTGIEPKDRLGRIREKIQRTISWLFGYRRLTVCYERKGRHFAAFLSLAAALTCYKKLTT